MSDAGAAVVIGKMPAHGDFIARGIQGAARQAVEGWLAASDLAARELFPDWQQRFDAAPPWRFVRPGADGLEAGVIASSCDKVGRRSPLLIWRRGVDARFGAPLAEAAEAIMYDALVRGWDADRLHTALLALDPPAGDAWQGGARWWICDADGAQVDQRAGDMPPDLLTAMLACVEEA